MLNDPQADSAIVTAGAGVAGVGAGDDISRSYAKRRSNGVSDSRGHSCCPVVTVVVTIGGGDLDALPEQPTDLAGHIFADGVEHVLISPGHKGA